MTRLAAIASAALIVALLTGCAATDPAPASAAPSALPQVRIASLKGPTTMGLVKLMDDAAAGLGDGGYDVSIHGSADEVVPLLVQGKRDIALIPANLAAVLYQRTVGTGDQIAVLAINTLGVLSVVEAGESITSFDDLRGRTIYSTGKGTTPELVLNFLLTANGLTPGADVTVIFKSEATEVAAMLANEAGAVGVLPQPYVTALMSANPQVRIAMDLTEEWDKVAADSQLVTGVVVVRAAFAAEHPETVSQFMADYRASTEFTNDHPDQAATLIAAAGITPDAATAAAAIPRSHITFIDGVVMKQTLSGYLNVLFAADPTSVGGSLPGDDFYYGE